MARASPHFFCAGFCFGWTRHRGEFFIRLNKLCLSSPADALRSLPIKPNAIRVLAERLKNIWLVKYRLLRALSEVPILTRETFEEQIAGDPIEQIKGQMMMF